MAAADLAMAAVLVALLMVARVRRRLSTVVAFDLRRLSEVHITPVEVSVDQVARLDFTMVVTA